MLPNKELAEHITMLLNWDHSSLVVENLQGSYHDATRGSTDGSTLTRLQKTSGNCEEGRG